MNQRQNPTHLYDYLKSNRKGSREAELMISPGWTAKDRPHKSRKMYDRKREKRDWKNDTSDSAFLFAGKSFKGYSENDNCFLAVGLFGANLLNVPSYI
jgi:hypothetical protein